MNELDIAKDMVGPIMNFDIVIASKDRHPLLFKQINRIKNRFPYNKVIVVDSTEIIPSNVQRFYDNEQINYQHTPNAKLGYARNIGVKAVSTPFFFMIDDDIDFKNGLAEKLYDEIIKYGANVFAMSPVILFGNNDNILSVYKRKKRDTEGVSSGFCIMNKVLYLRVGGFNSKIHLGEDGELKNRAKRHGYKWIRKHDLFVNHPGTDVDFIFRTWRQRKGLTTSVSYGLSTYHGWFLNRIKHMFLNLLSYLKYRNFRSTMFLMSNDLISLISYVRAIIGGEEYALHKKKIV